MIRAAQARAARKRYREMATVLDEQSRRRFVAPGSASVGRGGVSLMARITGLARSTIYHGLSDIRERVSAPPGSDWNNTIAPTRKKATRQKRAAN
jgi:hypothetical protein